MKADPMLLLLLNAQSGTYDISARGLLWEYRVVLVRRL